MFEDYPKTVKLRDGQEIELRRMVEADEQALFDFFNSLGADDVAFLKEDVTNPKVIERWVKQIDYDRVIPILACKGNKILADATLHCNQYGWSRHVGEIRIVTHPEYRKRGMGSILAREIFFLAIKLKLEKVMAHVLEDHQDGIKVFTRLGFNPEAVLHDHAVDMRGKKHNLIIMSQSITEFWQRIQDMFEEYSKVRSGTTETVKDAVM
ncbi:MAG: GNAT family N-acetyltransferase [Candidatus Omnitrophica bacterium]|nr:GNAT family N-acetyltransferase [Candidatus Omnitrophota bacterium]